MNLNDLANSVKKLFAGAKQGVQNYQQQVQEAKQTPFFNNTDNNPKQWIGKVVQDVKKRGPFEGLQDITYPITMSPYIRPILEPVTGKVRVANYKLGRPNPLINNLLGQTDKQMVNPKDKPIPDAIKKIIQKEIQKLSQTYIKSPSGEMFPQAVYKKPLAEQNKIYADYFQNLAFGATSGPTSIAKSPHISALPYSEGSVSSQAQKVVSPIKERGFVTSVKEAEELAKRTIKNVKGMYKIKPNTQLMGEANALLTEGASLDFKNVQGLDKKVAATIKEAINLDKAGNHEAAAHLFNNLSKHGTELGRGVQAFSMLDKMSPEAIAMSAAGQIRKYNQTALRKIPELTGQQQKIISDQVTALDLLKGREKNIALNELENTINSFIPSSLVDKATTVWKAGLLTSLRTHERNFLGNLIHGTMEVAKDIPGTVADMGMSTVTGKRSMSFTAKGAGEFASKNTRQQMADIVSKGYDPSEMVTKFDYKKINWGGNALEQGLKKYTDIVFNTLGAADKPFYNAALSRSLYDQAGTAAINAGRRGDAKFIESIVKHPSEEIMKIAIGDANVATFKNKNVASGVASAIKRAMSSENLGPIGSEVGKLAAEITMPFTGVPSSILGQTINYSPVGLLKGIAKVGQVALGHMPEFQRQAAQEVGRGVIGTGIFALGAYLMGKGLITGQPKDAEEQRLWDLQNKPRNSIMLFGKWRSLNSIGPEALVFLSGAKLKEEQDNPEGSTSNYALGLGKDYLDQSFVQGLKSPVNALTDPKRYGQSFAGGLLSSFIPNIGKDAAKSNDPYMREANSVTDYFKSNIPGVRNTMIPSRDALGNIRPQEPTGIGAYVDLFNSKTPISNPVVDEFANLNKQGTNAVPGTIDKGQTINGVKQSLTPEQINLLESEVGPEATQRLETLFSSNNYKSLGVEEKATAIDSVMTAARKKVRGTIDLSKVSPNPSGFSPSVQASNSTSSISKQYQLINKETGSVKDVDLSITTRPSLTGIASIDDKLKSAYESDINSKIKDVVDLYKDGQLSLTEAEGEIKKLENSAVDLNPISPPKLTGSIELDKKALARFNSDITSQANGIYSLWEAGQLTQDEAEKMLVQLKTLKDSYKVKKPKKISIKKISIKPIKFKTTAVKKLKIKKSPTFKLSKTKSAKISVGKLPKFKMPRLTA